MIWDAMSMNSNGQMTQYQSGNSITTTKTYDCLGILRSIVTGTVQNNSYSFDEISGNMVSRKDNLNNLTEIFSYDNLGRLTEVSGPALLSTSYADNGNIIDKTSVGNYSYSYPTLPHAVIGVTNPDGLISSYQQQLNYTSYNKTESISEYTNTYQLTYGANDQRNMSKYYNYGTLQKTVYYVGDYEKEVVPGSYDKHIHYIYGGDGLAAISTLSNGTTTMYYVHKDHLGSLDKVTNSSGTVVQTNSFDAWGRRRNPSNWTYNNIPTTIFSRGYTGHEHLDVFGLINMNGRMYDPILGRFLSPDNFVQASDFTQSFNRYSYCMNNPLIYTDPSGEFFLGTISAFIGNFIYTTFLDGGLSFNKDIRNDAWRDFDPSASWSATNKAFKIDIGGFKTDPNRTIAGRGLQMLSRWTWELPQTLFGKGYSHLRNMTGNVDNVDYYGGATLVNKNDNSGWWWGLTLGPYINSKNMVADPYTDAGFRHEYGHTLQSRLVGPLYLTHVGLPSLIGSGLDIIGLNDHDREWYETQANRMSERYFSNHDPGALTALPWNDNRFPKNYKPNWYWIFSHPPVPFMWWLFF